MSQSGASEKPRDPTGNRRCSLSGGDSVKCATGHGRRDGQVSYGKSVTGTTLPQSSLPSRKPITIGTWNTRGLLQTGKLFIVERELERCDVDIAGISETHWKGKGHFNTQCGHTVVFSGGEHSRNGVAFILSPRMGKCLIGYNTVSDRIISIKINATPVPINIIQVYLPTSDATDQEIGDIYGSIEDELQKIPDREITMITGDFNAKVGNMRQENHLSNAAGNYGIGKQNERGERLINFCIENNFTIANTIYKQHIRRLYTWTSPDKKTKNQIDYILIKTRWRTSVTNAKTLPGAECGSDHRLLIINFKLKLKVPRKRIMTNKVNIDDNVAFQEKLNPLAKARQPKEHSTPNEMWTNIKEIVKDTIDTLPKKEKQQKRQHWMTEETFKLVEERRNINKLKLDDIEKQRKQKQINKEIQKRCRMDKNNYVRQICDEAQIHADNNNTKDLYRLIKKINKNFKPHTWNIQKPTGELVTEIREVLEVWRTYCEELFDDSEEEDDITKEEEEPAILKDEVRNAIRKLKSDKSPGIDGITAEVIKAMGETGVYLFQKLCQRIWTTGNWPEEWTHSVLMPIHKKGSHEKCDNYRLIALLSHASKIFLIIINERIKSYLSWQIPDEQAGFVKGRGTREQILNLRQIIEKSREVCKPAYLCFIDYRKAFDSLKWEKLWKILNEMGVPQHLTFLIKKLYTCSNASVRVDNQLSKNLKIKKGARQGCILSPILFNIYGEQIMRETLEDWEGGISIGGTRIINLRYADDTVLFANTKEELEELMLRLETHSNNYGLKINRDKTKVMIIDRESNNRPDINQVGRCQVVKQYIYLGALITNMGGCSEEIKRRCEVAKRATRDLQRTWIDSNITLNTKKQIIKTLIFPIILYTAESWTIKANDKKRIDATEMWCWRRMLRIPWTAKRTNISVLEEIQEPQRLSQIVNSRILKYFGHVSRHDNIERLVVQGRMEGTRPRGRSPKRWTDQIKEAIEMPVTQAAREASNRGKWRSLIRRVTSGNT